MANYIDRDNFNPTCKGYIIMVLKDSDLTEMQMDRIMHLLDYEFDMHTFEEARATYEKYCKGEITFKEK